MFKVDFKKIIIIVIAIAAVHGIAPNWCKWLMDSALGDKLNAIYVFLNKYIYLNAIVASLIVICGVLWSWHIVKDKDFRWYRPILVILGFTILYDQNTLAFVKLSENINYRDLAAIIGVAAFISMGYKCLDYKFFISDKIIKWYREIIDRGDRSASRGGMRMQVELLKVA